MPREREIRSFFFPCELKRAPPAGTSVNNKKEAVLMKKLIGNLSWWMFLLKYKLGIAKEGVDFE